MDRNDKFKKRIENKLNQPNKKATMLPKVDFDASPYVDMIIDKMTEEDGQEMTDFMGGLLTNPRFDFIFGKSSVLSTNQKTKVAFAFTHRLLALQDFDPTPFSKELAGMWGSPEFEQFWVTGKDGAKTLNFDLYFEKYNFTREQKAMIIEDFHDIQKLLSKRNRVAIIIPFFIALLIVVVPPFYIPNFLQRLGWISPDAGWFIKITIGLVSGVVLFYLAKIIFTTLVDYLLKKQS